jgi:transposase
VKVEHASGTTWHCPTCGQAAPLHDHGPARTWRHLDSCQFQTHLQARPPRVNCPEHGVRNVKLPWAEPGGRFTVMMERFVIRVLEHCQNITAACQLLGLNWDQAAHVMERAVERGLARRVDQPTRYLGVDEKRYRRGHVYATVVSDLDRGAVLEVIDQRRSESLATFYRGLSPDQRQAIEAVAMDMCLPYQRATIDHLPDGASKIVFDRFHIMKHLTDALDRVRQREHAKLSRQQIDTLARTRQLWLWSEPNLPAKHRDRFEQLKTQDLRTARAWALKENLRHLWSQPTPEAARDYFSRWYDWVQREAIKPITHVAKTIKTRLDAVVRFCRHPITTAACEGINSRISAIQHRAAGFRNFQRLRQAILFYQGQLDLYP